MTSLKSRLREYLRQSERATKVVGWYPHSDNGRAEVRGPFCRWIIREVLPEHQKHVAQSSDDAAFVAGSMTLGPLAASTLLEALDVIEASCACVGEPRDQMKCVACVFLASLDQEGGG